MSAMRALLSSIIPPLVLCQGSRLCRRVSLMIASARMSVEKRVGTPPPLLGPSELVLTTSVARRYYLDGRSKIEIAEEFRLSRFKVARLLDAAREQGLVTIEIKSPGIINAQLSAQLRDEFNLLHAIVVNTPDAHEASLRRQLGQASAELLMEIITPHDVLGLIWARSVNAMAAQLRHLPPIPVVQLTGALPSQGNGASSPDEGSSIDVVRDVARVAGGSSYVFFAPFLVPDQATAETLRHQPDVDRAFSQIATVTKAVGGIGRWAPGQSTLFDAATDAERLSLAKQGVCAEVGGVFLTSDGQPVHTVLNDRMVGISAAEMQTIPEVIAIAYGGKKQPAVLAGLRSGLVKGLVTPASLAAALLIEGHSTS